MPNNKLYVSFLFLALVSLLAANVSAAPINATLNKPATLNGLFGVLRAGSPWTAIPVDPAGSIDDGVFRTDGTDWNAGSIWWDAAVEGSESNSIVIDLQGPFHITGIITQADNNDNYQIDYFDPFTSSWNGLGYWPAIGGYGLMTRPAGDPVTLLPITFDASMIRLSAFNNEFGGDSYFSYSEFQAFGEPIPEPGTVVLLTAGLAGLLALRRRA